MGVAGNERRDFYYFQAKIQGYRARSAFKLIEIDEEFNIIEKSTRIVDLCAAPGSWSQALRQRTDAKIVSIDLQEMEPIENVCILKQDITSAKCIQSIQDAFEGEKVDLIVCDGAPDVTGFQDLDVFLQLDLLKAALNICTKVMSTGSTFIAKCFMGEDIGHVVCHFRKFFDLVDLVKPKSSRCESSECFLVCRLFKASYPDPFLLNLSGESEIHVREI